MLGPRLALWRNRLPAKFLVVTNLFIGLYLYFLKKIVLVGQ